MSKKRKLTNYVHQEGDNSFFCGKCGRANFSSQASVLGHLAHCKGFKHQENELKRTLKGIGLEQSDVENKLKEGDHDSSPSINDLLSGDTLLGPTSPTPTPRPRPTLEAYPSSSKNESSLATNRSYYSLSEKQTGDDDSDLRVIVSKLVQSQMKINKHLFNHSQHVDNLRPVKVNFNSPSDMMGAVFGEVYQIPLVRILLVMGGIVMVYNFVRDQVDKANNTGKNNRKKK